ncbi:MAG: recombinase family protein [Patescibacteria group bacterium]
MDSMTVNALTYAIYARKSSDESSGKQYKSIDEQLEACYKLADSCGIVVKKEHVFTESRSAKRAKNRPIFAKLLEMVEKGKLDGVVAWHPDRLSRNMFEAGRVIELIDDGKLKDLKFCTHHFENTASGKMMLGILFAISKEYSDKLSEDVSRGVKGAFEAGQSSGTPKWGYLRNSDDGLYEPDPATFDYIQEAWKRRLNEETLESIADWLSMVGCTRETSKGRIIKTPNKTILGRIFCDPFYYGVLRQTDKLKDLRDLYDFKAMVTEEEFLEVQRIGKGKKKTKVKQSFPFRNDLVQCSCGNTCFPTAAKGRGGNLYLYLVCRARKQCPNKKYSLRSKVVLEAIEVTLKKSFKPTAANYKKYQTTFNQSLDQHLNDVTKGRTNLTRNRNKLCKELDELNLGRMKLANQKKLSRSEEASYEKEKFRLESQIKECDQTLKKLEDEKLFSIFSYEEFSNFLKKSDLYWKRADAEQKHQLATFLFSNIIVEDGKVLELHIKPLIKDLFVPNGGDAGN